MRLAGRTAVITGGANGIGRAIAVSLARRGCHLALADIDEDGMTGTAELIRDSGVRVTQHRVDVADRVAVAQFLTSSRLSMVV
jgi:NAD(P)-dependent dehydrogenase (short-subunit alcohol dehydrogenase family)